MNSFLISLIVPVYNGGSYIQHLFRQFEGQPMDAVELVCIDDGSTDDSYAQLQHMAENVDFAVSVFHQENQGVSAARNLGMEKARGEYVAFLDVDDGITSDYLTTLKEKAKLGMDVLAFGSQRVLEGFTREEHPVASDNILSKNQMLNLFWNDPTCFGVVNLLLKKSYVQAHSLASPVGYKYYEDYDLLLQVFSQTDSIHYLDKVMYYYILREGSAMGRFNADRVNCLALMQQRGIQLETDAPEFAPVFQKWGTSRLYWSVLWQAALAFPSYKDFAKFAEKTGAKHYLRRLTGHPDRIVKLSSVVFLCCKRVYFLVMRAIGSRKSKVQPVPLQSVLDGIKQETVY